MSPREFGVQSYCFRHFKDNAAVAKMVRQIGLDKIEVCGVHADLNDPAAFKDVVKTYQDEGVSVVSIGVETFTGDRDHAKRRFDCAAAAGAKHLSCHVKVDSFGESIPLIAGLADEYGITPCLHCHGGYMFGGQPDVLQHLLALGRGEVGLCLDTAWCMQIGPGRGNPVDWAADTFKGQIHGVHYKDFTFDPNGQWNDVVVGQGTLDLPAFMSALEAGGFDGYSVIEYEADVENPVPALTRCVEQMRSV
jgi:sugar phosphate isomerase/epimerase